MKIKSRKQLLKEYNIVYKDKTESMIQRLEDYFNERNLNLNKALKKALVKAQQIQDTREYTVIHITMYEYPMKTDRPRVLRSGHTFSPNAAANKAYLQKAIKKLWKEIKLIHTPSTIRIDAYLEMPNSIPADEVILYELDILNVETIPDYDNIGKCYTDMLKDVLIVDDDIFYCGTIHKHYSVLPRVEICIKSLKEHESEYIYKRLKNRKNIKELIKKGYVEIHKTKKEGKP